MTLFFAVALAADPLWWTEEGITRQSSLFGKAQARDADAFDQAQKELEAAKRLVGDLELGVAAVGGEGALAAYAEELGRSLSGQFLRLQKHADLLGTDYARVFGSAVDRAIPVVAEGQSVTECRPRSQVEALLGRGPRCPGVDVSGRIAARIDQDPELQAAIAEILSLDWPSVRVEGTAQSPLPLTGTERSVDVASLLRTVQGEELRALDDARDIAIEELSDDLDGEDREAKEAAVKQAAAARATWARGVAALGTRTRATARKALDKAAKKGGPVAVALCPNPAGLGGCGVPDATAEVLALFRD
jgi:hypothetical protein